MLEVVGKMYYFPKMNMNDIYGSKKPWDERNCYHYNSKTGV